MTKDPKLSWRDIASVHDDAINGHIFRVTGHLCGEFICHRWIPLTKAIDAKLWCFLWSVPEHTIEKSNRYAKYLGSHRPRHCNVEISNRFDLPLRHAEPTTSTISKWQQIWHVLGSLFVIEITSRERIGVTNYSNSTVWSTACWCYQRGKQLCVA